MALHTASEVITLSRKLENDSADFYENLAQRYNEAAEAFLSFARDNRKNVAQIQRAYYGVISDAIEGGFAFNIDPDDYSLKMAVQDGASFSDVLDRAVEMERTIIQFYSDAAEQSKSLMADVPRSFMMVAKKRVSRILQLGSLPTN